MNHIRQNCPSCDRLLELPGSAVGRTAKCPACEATFPVLNPAPAAEPPPAPAGFETVEASSDDPHAAHSGLGLSDPGHAVSSANPYSPTSSQIPHARSGELPAVPVSLETLSTATLAIFGQRWMHVVAAFLFCAVAGIAVWFVPVVVFLIALSAGANDPNAGLVFGIVLLLSIPFAVLASGYLSIAMARNAIAVARNHPSPFSQLVLPLPVMMRATGGAIILGFGLILGLVILSIPIGIAGAVADGPLSGLVAVLSSGVMIFASFAAYWLFWSWMSVVGDGQMSVFGAIRTSLAITMQNKVQSVVLIVIATVLSTAGSLACYVGLILTQPLTNLMFAVAYLAMTNQRYDQPGLRRSVTPNPNVAAGASPDLQSQ